MVPNNFPKRKSLFNGFLTTLIGNIKNLIFININYRCGYYYYIMFTRI